MYSKILYSCCAFAFFVKTISTACINSIPTITEGQWISNDCGNAILGIGNSGIGISGIGIGNCGCNGIANCGSIASATGGYFPVSSASSIFPNGVSVLSENAIEGCLDVVGQIPFLGAVGLEGQVVGAGSAAIQYGCGNGNVRIISEGFGNGAGLPLAGVPITGYEAPFIGYADGFNANLGCGSAPVIKACGFY